MTKLKDLRRPISLELQEFERHFESSMQSTVPLIDRITHYIVKSKGKQVRPMLVLLSAKTIAPINQNTHVAASVIELLHTASLLHDDVVDDAHMRRGFFSINAIWKNKIAVLGGDFMLSRGMSLALKHKQYRALHLLSDAVTALSEGELLQIEKSRKLDITEEVYYEIISNKTASMIAASTAAGAASVTDKEEVIQRMKDFGHAAGMAYQIKDDLFDYGYANVGKPTGNDIKEKKFTLPLIYALQQADPKSRKKIISLIKKKSEQSLTRKTVLQFVQEHSGLEYASRKMEEYQQQALHILETFPENDSRHALSKLIEFIIKRQK